jgi:hypothetical protein
MVEKERQFKKEIKIGGGFDLKKLEELRKK